MESIIENYSGLIMRASDKPADLLGACDNCFTSPFECTRWVAYPVLKVWGYIRSLNCLYGEVYRVGYVKARCQPSGLAISFREGLALWVWKPVMNICVLKLPVSGSFIKRL